MTQPSGDKPYLTKPTTQTDLEARAKRDFKPEATTVDANAVNDPYAVEGNDTSAYVGVDPSYMTYASDTEKPLAAESGSEAKALDQLTSGLAYGEVTPSKENKQTVGSGSSVPLVTVATSGEDVSHEIVKPSTTSAPTPSSTSANSASETTTSTTTPPPASTSGSTTTPTPSGPTPTSTS